MSKRKFGFGGFGIAKKANFEFEASPAPRRLYLPSPTRRGGADEEEDYSFVDDVEDRKSGSAGKGKAVAEDSDYDGGGGRQESSDDEEDGGRGKDETMGGDEDIDPLDAFMEGIHEEVEKAPLNPRPEAKDLGEDEDDPVESYLRAHRDAGLSLAAEALHAGYDSDEEVYAAAKAVDNGMVEYDSDDNPIITTNRKKVESLPALDHSDIDYEPFNKDFYEENAAIANMTEEEVAAYRQSLLIKVSGFDVSRPVKKFEELGFEAPLMTAISKQGYEKPTPIQCQGLPIALSGRDMIGIAKTGSGKTAAFVLPLIVHIMDQAELEKGEGPIAVICSPTRELAHQIYSEAKKFAKAYGIRVSGVYGGMSKFEQFKELKAGCEIVVATPGRLIDMLKMTAVTMLRGTFLVLDEADRMFDLGFEPQIQSIVGQMRPDRQTMLFSATMPRRVERLAREVLSDPIRVTVGEVGMANEDITQLVTVLGSDEDKMPWLLEKLPAFVDYGDTLVFASTKIRVEEVEGKLRIKGFKVAALHGDKDQASRMEVLKKFKTGEFHVLVATDVAARGLDIKSIKTVVNFDIAKDMDGHVHRIGRTGRAGDKDGVAHTLVTQKESRFGGELVNSLIAAGQNIPKELMDLAMKNGRFRAQREGRGGGGFGGGKVKGRGRGGRGGRGGGGGGAGTVGGGGGRSVRGVDFGLGIGYSADSVNKASQPSTFIGSKPKPALPAHNPGEVMTRVAAIGSLKMGMMARFKSNFVAASPGIGPAGSGSSLAGTPQAPAQNAAHDGVVYGSSTRENGRGRGLGSAGVPSRGHVSAYTTGNSTGAGRGDQSGDWNKASGGVGGFVSSSNPSPGSLRSETKMGGFVPASSRGGSVPTTYNFNPGSTTVREREVGNIPSAPTALVQGSHNGASNREGDWSQHSVARQDGVRGLIDDDQAGEKGGSSREKNRSENREQARERRRPSGWDR